MRRMPPSLDSYEYRYCYIYADIPESTTDEDGKKTP